MLDRPRRTIDGDADFARKYARQKARILNEVWAEVGHQFGTVMPEIVPHVRGYKISQTYPLTNMPFRSQTVHGPVTQLIGVSPGAWNAVFFENYQKNDLIDYHITSLDIFRAYEDRVPALECKPSDERWGPSHFVKIWDINQFHPSLLIAASPRVWAQVKARQLDLF